MIRCEIPALNDNTSFIVETIKSDANYHKDCNLLRAVQLRRARSQQSKVNEFNKINPMNHSHYVKTIQRRPHSRRIFASTLIQAYFFLST